MPAFLCSDQFVVWSERRDDASLAKDSDRGGPLHDDDDGEKRKGEGEEEEENVQPTVSSSDYGAILPMVQVAGTATRRAVEATWLTASNPKVSLIFSPFMSLI